MLAALARHLLLAIALAVGVLSVLQFFDPTPPAILVDGRHGVYNL